MDDPSETPRGDNLEKRRAAGALDDRIIVALAASVLLAGVLIATGNLLKGLIGDASASAASTPSAIPQPAATVRPTPMPRPPREVTVVPGTPNPEVPSEPVQTAAWLEVLSDVPLMSAPDGGRELDLVPAGSVVLATLDAGHPGWGLTQEQVGGGHYGWIATRDSNGEVVAIAHPLGAQVSSGRIDAITAASGGYVAIVYPAAPTLDGTASTAYTSADGEQWEMLPEFAQSVASVWLMADGPAGLLAVSRDEFGTGIWEWESYPGSSWSSVGSLDRLGLWPLDFVGSARGYLLEARSEGWVDSGELWYSPDGLVWQESPISFGAETERRTRLLAVEGGFVAWAAPYAGFGTVDFVNGVAFSPNGRTWTRVEMDGTAGDGPAELVAIGSKLLGLATTESGTVHVWRADLAAGSTMHLARDPTQETAFPRLEVIEAVSDGERAYLLGFDKMNHTAHLWENDGEGWSAVAWPSADRIGPFPRLGALGPNGLLLIGSRPTVAGPNHVIWRLRPSGSWARETDPIIPLVSGPGLDECGQLPTSALEFAVLPQAWGPTCFGDEPMTFTAYATCSWCGSDAETLGRPQWLMRWPPDLFLRPAEGDESYALPAVLAADLPRQGWLGRWVRVTGHYGDPEAGTCEWIPADAYRDYWWDWSESAEAWCSEQFVITAIEAVEGP